jgi:alpha-tubulin suppressor-like RCC1 family protein
MTPNLRHALARAVSTAALVAISACGEQTAQTTLTAPDSPLAASAKRNPAVKAVEISAGLNHNCAIQRNGPTYCWGWNEFGQIGDGSFTSRSWAVPVAGNVKFTQISAGDYHTCALTSAGAAYCWGYGTIGQLGNGAFSNSAVPVAVAGGYTFHQIAGGELGTCALTTAGSVYCWGFIMGFGSSATPVQVSGNLTFTSIALGGSQGCGVATGGQTYCFQIVNDGSVVGDPRLIASPQFTKLVASQRTTCGLSAAGAAYCFGGQSDGMLGAQVADTMSALVPVDGNHVFTTISMGYASACGITATGERWCWGRNYDLSYPIGPSDATTTPVQVTTTAGLGISRTEHGFSHSCGLASRGEVWCWGNLSDGELADGRDRTNTTFPFSYEPVLARRLP